MVVSAEVEACSTGAASIRVEVLKLGCDNAGPRPCFPKGYRIKVIVVLAREPDHRKRLLQRQRTNPHARLKKKGCLSGTDTYIVKVLSAPARKFHLADANHWFAACGI